MLWGGLELAAKGPDLGEDSLGKQSRRKSIVQPFRIFYSLPLSYRDVQELLCERGIDVTHEAIR